MVHASIIQPARARLPTADCRLQAEQWLNPAGHGSHGKDQTDAHPVGVAASGGWQCRPGEMYRPPDHSVMLVYWYRLISGPRYSTTEVPLCACPNLCVSVLMLVTLYTAGCCGMS